MYNAILAIARPQSQLEFRQDQKLHETVSKDHALDISVVTIC